MVERLIRRQKVDEQPDLNEFKEKHSDMFKFVKQSLAPIEEQYNIEVNPEEIRLIIDIILGDD
jgi:Transcriptional antiterminator